MDIKKILYYFEANKTIEKGTDLEHVLSKGCFSDKNNEMILDASLLLSFANEDNYKIIQERIVYINEQIISKNNGIVSVHLNVKSLNLNDLYKHYNFIQNICILLQKDYPNVLEKCYLYNTSPIFSYIFQIISVFLELETRNKIIIV